MKRQILSTTDRSKTVPVTTLFVTAVLIFILGAAFSVYSIISQVSLKVLDYQVPGAVWGMVMMFLGIRYYVAVRRLKAEVYKSTTQFSWDHFKSEKSRQQPSDRR